MPQINKYKTITNEITAKNNQDTFKATYFLLFKAAMINEVTTPATGANTVDTNR
jgi:hypothetical protein